jgi:nitronate monooxygenase
VGQIEDIATAGEIIARMKEEYDAARARLGLVR